MRPLLLACLLLLTVQLAPAEHSYYNAETCGIVTTGRVKRAFRVARSSAGGEAGKKTTIREEEDDEEDEEKEEKPEEKTQPAEEEVEPGLDDGYRSQMTEKVMGGWDALLGEMPWAAVLQIAFDGQLSLCGGTLISSRHVLTAAHCFIKDPKPSGCRPSQMMSREEITAAVRVTVGGICSPDSAEKCQEKERGETRAVVRVGLLTEFFLDKCKKSMWDVALLELDRPVTATHACLPHLHNLDKFETWKTGMLSFGYGSDPARGQLRHTYLQKVDLGPALNSTRCMQEWKLKYDTVVCTRESYTKNVCRGDSGGGILAQWKRRYYLVGTISFGSSCNAGLENALIANAQVNMDVNLYTATIDQFILKKTPDYRKIWTNPAK